MIDHLVAITDQKAVTTSMIVAEAFDKQHKNVLRSVERLECSDEFRRLNFQPSSYLNEQNKPQPMCQITRDGFSFLAMGFTGKKAAEFKEAFIAAFNQMEKCLLAEMEEAKRIDFTHMRGTFAPGNLDIRYTLDLTKICTDPTPEGVELLAVLTGHDLSAISAKVEKKSRHTRRLSHPNAVDPVLVADCLSIIFHSGRDFRGLKITPEGIEGRTKDINSAIASIAAGMGRPYRATGAQLGAVFAKKSIRSNSLEWKREHLTTIRGVDVYRYSKFGGYKN